MSEEFFRDREGNERYNGGGCQALTPGVRDGTGVGGEGIPDYSIEHRHEDDGIEVLVTGGDGGVFLTRRYDRSFLASGEVDEFVVDFPDGERLRLRYWGGSDCESVRSPDPS